jgi:hypothetical protein
MFLKVSAYQEIKSLFVQRQRGTLPQIVFMNKFFRTAYRNEENTLLALGRWRGFFFFYLLVVFYDFNSMQFSPLGFPKTDIPQGIFTVLPSIDSHWFTAIENIWLVSVVFSALGLLGFASIPVAFIASLYKLGYCESFGIMTFATHIPVLMIFVLCFTPCCRRFSFDELFFKIYISNFYTYFYISNIFKHAKL